MVSFPILFDSCREQTSHIKKYRGCLINNPVIEQQERIRSESKTDRNEIERNKRHFIFF